MSDVSGPKTRLAKLRIGADHPSLPGHFPGRPIVPAVVLLNRIVDCAVDEFGASLRIDGIVQAKFIVPLLPDQNAIAMLTWEGKQLRFRVVMDDAGENALVAQGSFSTDSAST